MQANSRLSPECFSASCSLLQLSAQGSETNHPCSLGSRTKLWRCTVYARAEGERSARPKWVTTGSDVRRRLRVLTEVSQERLQVRQKCYYSES